MKRTLCLVFIFVFLTSFIFSGCGSNNQAQTATTSGNSSTQAEASSTQNAPTANTKIIVTPQLIGDPDAKISISWLPKDGLDTPNKAVATYLADKAKAWVEKNPDVKIIPIAQTVNIQDAMAKLMVQVAAGNAPDVSGIDSFLVSKYYGYLQPVDDILKEKNIPLDSWFPFAQNVMKPKDKILAMMFTTDVRLFYYRKDLIQTPPTNWDELITTAKQMSDKGNVGFLYPAGRNETTSCDFLPYFWSQGGKLVDDSGNPVFNQGDNKTYMLNALNFIKQTIDEGISPKRVSTFKADSDMNSEIASGKVAMFLGGNWLAKQVSDIIGTQQFSDLWAVAPIPMKAGASRTTTSGGWTLGIFTDDEQKRKLAADFVISLYIDDEGMAGYCSAYGLLPPRKTIYDSAEPFKTNTVFQQCKEELEYTTIRPGASIYNVISQDLQIALSNVITGVSTPEKALDEAWNDVLKQKDAQKQ
ncbi:MAG: hypothetical protein A2Y21_11585 [Clostridiales bacterium GWC2_40_7]|nr:MAG: hypothetical protein A2Y21_11585 [Clostridiales bacterium GWC2_40_7]